MIPRQQLILLTLTIIHIALILLIQRRTGRRWWVHPMNMSRDQTSMMRRVEALRDYPDRFFGYFRMYPPAFDHLLNLVTPLIQKQTTVMRAPIDPATRLAVTLHYLATGSSFATIATHFALGKSTVSTGIISETCQAIWTVLSDTYLKPPSTHEEWKRLAGDFYEKWDFPNCVGAVDGKHVMIRAPSNTGTSFFNYKKTFSIVLMAVVDANYKFTMIDVGQMGSVADGGVWDHSTIGNGWNRDEVNTPPPENLPGTVNPVPYFIVGDEAFPLKPNLMRPYPGAQVRGDFDKRRLNYRLSRARRVVENAFGILSSRWRFLFTPIAASYEKATDFVKAAVVLHNYLCSIHDNGYIPVGFGDNALRNGHVVDGFWRAEVPDLLENLPNHPPRHAARVATEYRDMLKNWVANEGQRDWQDDLLNRVN